MKGSKNERGSTQVPLQLGGPANLGNTAVKGIAADSTSIRSRSTLLDPGQDFLVGQFLIAMPDMGSAFERSVIYLCAHSEEGAMGLVINKTVDHITFPELLDQLDIDSGSEHDQIRVHYGGPVDSSRGFVLHSADYFMENSTLRVSPAVGLTATVDILRAMSEGNGPRQSFLALGYAGWGPGQLEGELHENAWLHAPADVDLLFANNLDIKWNRALDHLGIGLEHLAADAGRA